MTALTLTVKARPELVNFRYLGDCLPDAKPAEKPKTRTAAKPEPEREEAAPVVGTWKYPTREEAAKPCSSPIIDEIGPCGYITVRDCKIRCFRSGEGVFLSITDIARAFGKRPDSYNFLPGFVAYARTPHSMNQLMKWVENGGLVEWTTRKYKGPSLPEFAIFQAYRTYQQL